MSEASVAAAAYFLTVKKIRRWALSFWNSIRFTKDKKELKLFFSKTLLKVATTLLDLLLIELVSNLSL